jgi:lipopolysaccharide/colanic/teichoic acid biosynthesis glycosyltransferase
MLRPGLPRWLDVLLAAIALVLSLPVFLVAAVAVRLSSAGPVIFRQQRVGKAGQRFQLFKFRSMRPNTKSFEVTSADDPLITSVGRVLRWTKIDELPSFVNVLRGDMSLVGPRPEVPSLVDMRDRLWDEVLSVTPGLTDPVTLALRNEERLLAEARRQVGDVERFYHQLQRWKLRNYCAYLRRRSAWTDLGVLIQTVLVVAGARPTNAPTVTDIEAANGPQPSPRRPRS